MTMFSRALRPLCATALVALAPTAMSDAAHAQTLPAGADDAVQRLNDSPRHGEWIEYDAGGGDMVRAWVTYPERGGPAPVVVVIHEIFGLTDWIRAVADQLSADGFIAIAPDLLSGHGPGGSGTPDDQQAAVALIRELDRADVNRRLRAAASYATGLPAATERVGVVGFCWGGSSSFLFAVDYGDLDAAVVYYGGSPDGGYESIRAPVLGLYGGNDNRVNATIPRAEEAMSDPPQSFEPHIFEGAGHGFLRAQSGQDGANLRATQQAWPLTVTFFREHLGS